MKDHSNAREDIAILIICELLWSPDGLDASFRPFPARKFSVTWITHSLNNVEKDYKYTCRILPN